MKPTSALLLLLAPVALAQTKSTTTHHTATAAHRTTSSACPNPAPTLPASVTKVEGCPKPLYALTFIDTVVGTGDAITPRKWLTVNYTGYLLDGTKFDSSIGKEPITFPYGAHRVIAGWDTGFEGMHIGGKRRLFIPYQLAYGEEGRPPVIPVKAELVFDVELLGISDQPPAPKTPPTPPAGTAPKSPGNQTPGNQPSTTPPPASSPTSTPPAGTGKSATDAPTQPGTQPSAQQVIGKPTTAPTPSSTTAPTDPTKPAAVPPKR